MEPMVIKTKILARAGFSAFDLVHQNGFGFPQSNPLEATRTGDSPTRSFPRRRLEIENRAFALGHQ